MLLRGSAHVRIDVPAAARRTNGGTLPGVPPLLGEVGSSEKRDEFGPAPARRMNPRLRGRENVIAAVRRRLAPRRADVHRSVVQQVKPRAVCEAFRSRCGGFSRPGRLAAIPRDLKAPAAAVRARAPAPCRAPLLSAPRAGFRCPRRVLRHHGWMWSRGARAAPGSKLQPEACRANGITRPSGRVRIQERMNSPLERHEVRLRGLHGRVPRRASARNDSLVRGSGS